MSIGHSVRTGAWILISLNILMAFGSIWIFTRMAPAIEVILLQNEVSLKACEDMLAALLRRNGGDNGDQLVFFQAALTRAESNITEDNELAVIKQISAGYKAGFDRGGADLELTVAAILKLGEINRVAMSKADHRAQQLGHAGAWGVVFMAIAMFLAGMLFLRSLRTHLVEPLMEIQATAMAFSQGDIMRRCSLRNPPKAIRQVFRNFNGLLDVCCGQHRPSRLN